MLIGEERRLGEEANLKPGFPRELNLAGDVPAGLQTPRESVNPGLFVDQLSKRGVRVRAYSDSRR